MAQKWVSMREAATILKSEGYKISPNTVSRLANRGALQTREDPVDTRVRLVDLDELRRLFAFRRGETAAENSDEEE
jgi:hypothetical protein